LFFGVRGGGVIESVFEVIDVLNQPPEACLQVLNLFVEVSDVGLVEDEGLVDVGDE